MKKVTMGDLKTEGYICTELKDKRELFNNLVGYIEEFGGGKAWNYVKREFDKLNFVEGDQLFRCTLDSPRKDFIALSRDGIIVGQFLLRK